MNILITEEQLKVIIREGRYSNPLFFKLASDLFDEFFNHIKNPLEKNNFEELIKTVAENPEITPNEFKNKELQTRYLFKIDNVIKKNGLEKYKTLINKDNKILIDFITQIYNNKLIGYFIIDLGVKKTKDADVYNRFDEDKLYYFRISLYRNSFLSYELKNKLNSDDSEILQIILDLKNKLVAIITHELQHAYDSFNARESMEDDKIIKSHKDFKNFYNRVLINDLSKIKFYNDSKKDKEIIKLIKYYFEKREIWARIQQFFNSMNLENPEQLIFFYKERISGSNVIHYWAKRFVESVLMDVINKLKLDKKIEIPIDKFKRYLYKIFYQMLSYKVQLLIDDMKK